MNIHLLSFATSNWIKSKQRITSQAKVLSDKYDLFSSITFMTDKDLGNDYMDYFSRFTADPGFAYWSWKPYIIYNKLETIPEGDILVYIDGGCYLDDSILISDRIKCISRDLDKYDLPIAVGQSQNIDPIIIQVRKQVLEKFGLIDNMEFLFSFPHYEAGLQIIYNNKLTHDFMKRWYEFMRTNYEGSVRSERYDKNGQYSQFWRNGGDQQVFQCMLYTEHKHFCDLWNFWYKYGICRRIVG